MYKWYVNVQNRAHNYDVPEARYKGKDVSMFKQNPLHIEKSMVDSIPCLLEGMLKM